MNYSQNGIAVRLPGDTDLREACERVRTHCERIDYPISTILAERDGDTVHVFAARGDVDTLHALETPETYTLTR